VEFVEGSERWLLDHDYLTRNTTEHNMLSVLRNGRGNELVPSLAACRRMPTCLALATPTATPVTTTAATGGGRSCGSAGVFLIADTVTAREAGDYDLELTWKTIDSAGEQRLANAETSSPNGARDRRRRRTAWSWMILTPRAAELEAAHLDDVDGFRRRRGHLARQRRADVAADEGPHAGSLEDPALSAVVVDLPFVPVIATILPRSTATRARPRR